MRYYLSTKGILQVFCILFVFQNLLFSLQINSDSFLDIEEDSQDFVLEIKQIIVPGYGKAFNPSIIRWRGRLLMSFRLLAIPKKGGASPSALGLIWLDDNFCPVGEPQILRNKEISIDDCRLISIQDRLIIIFNRWLREVWSLGQKMYTAELNLIDDTFVLSDPVRFFIETYPQNPRIEKNWVPFDYKDQLLLSYSLQPHLVFLPNLSTGECKYASLTHSLVDWQLGELRGGTPALLDGRYYLAFFHSCQKMATKQSDGSSINHYFMGAYLFSNEPPFELTHISPRPITTKGFYSGPIYKPYWNQELRVVFPGGFIFDDDFIWIVYGRQDHECWVVKLDKKRLLKSLVPVDSLNDPREELYNTIS